MSDAESATPTPNPRHRIRRHRIRQLGVEHPPVPPKSPAALDRLDRSFGDELQLVPTENRRRQAHAQATNELLALGLDAMCPATRTLGEGGILVRPVALHVDRHDAANPIAVAGREQGDVAAERVTRDGHLVELEPVEKPEQSRS